MSEENKRYSPRLQMGWVEFRTRQAEEGGMGREIILRGQREPVRLPTSRKLL